MGLYEVTLFVSLLGFWIWTMLANFHMCGIMLLLRELIFSLSGPGELFFFTLFYCLLDRSCDVISLYFMCCSVNGSVCLVCLTVFVNCLVKQFAICLGVVVILLLNVMVLFSVVGGALLDRPCLVC